MADFDASAATPVTPASSLAADDRVAVGDVSANAGAGGWVAVTLEVFADALLLRAGTVTAAGRALLDDADAAAQRDTLGLGSAATTSSADYAAASHGHAAGDVTSGVFAAARLGTGSPDATNFLRGDGAWASASVPSSTLADTISANHNDYSPAGYGASTALLLVEPSGSSRTITGVAGGGDGRRLAIKNTNTGANTLSLLHNSASSLAANRIKGPSNANVVLGPGDGCTLVYSSSDSCWHAVGSSL